MKPIPEGGGAIGNFAFPTRDDCGEYFVGAPTLLPRIQIEFHRPHVGSPCSLVSESETLNNGCMATGAKWQTAFSLIISSVIAQAEEKGPHYVT